MDSGAEGLVGRHGNVWARTVVDASRRQRDRGLLAGKAERRSRSGSIGWAVNTLRDQGMPSKEIAAILGAHDPEQVRRYLELHRERLEEHLAHQRRVLARLERLLASRSRGSARDLHVDRPPSREQQQRPAECG